MTPLEYLGHIFRREICYTISKYNSGETVTILETDELVTISKWAYVKNMKRYSYTVKEHPTTFFFEEELEKA